MNQTIIRPIITERSMALAGAGKYTFIVSRAADKAKIKREIEKMFSVNVLGVSTTIVKGKTKRVGIRRAEVVSTPIKKAVVTVKSGQKIDLFEIGGE